MNDSTEVKLHFLDYWRVVRVRSGIISLVFLLAVITTGIWCYFAPRKYLSSVTMEVQPDDERIIINGNNSGVNGTSDTRFAPTQFQIIRQKEILYPVIDNLNLVQSWSPKGRILTREEIYFQLLHSMVLEDIRNTNLIVIGVKSQIPKEAADIANSIAVVYADKRRADQQALIDKGLAQLKEEVTKQQTKVDAAQKEAARIRTEQGIPDLDPEGTESTQSAENANVIEDQKEANDAKTRVTELKTKLEQIEKLKPEEVMVAFHILGIDDPTITKVLPLYQDAQAEEARELNSGLGPKHPKLQSLRAQKDVYAKQLSDQIEALRHSLATQLTIAETTQASLEDKLKSTNQTYIQTKNQSTEYVEAKGKYIQAKKILEQAELKYSSESMQENITTNPTKIWAKAEPSVRPTEPNVTIYMLIGVVAGLVVGLALAFFIEYLDTSVKTLDDVEKFLGVPVLAVIPKNVGLLFKTGGEESPDAEAFRILRTNIEFNRKNSDANTLTVISGGPGEGKSTTLCNLAYTCARGGYNVLLVDADLRRPSQHRNFEVENNVGLTNYLTSSSPFEEFIVPTSVKNLSFIPSGILPTDSVGILNSQRMTDLLFKAKRQYDLVFIDSPPILGVSDGSIIASEVDLTVMVIEHRRFPRSMLQRVKNAVNNVGGNLLGVVLNKVDTKHDQGYQYYTNYYDYYSPQRPEKSRSGAAGSSAGAKRPEPHTEQY